MPGQRSTGLPQGRIFEQIRGETAPSVTSCCPVNRPLFANTEPAGVNFPANVLL